MTLLNIVTALEVYLKEVFVNICINLNVEDITDKNVFVIFLKRFNVSSEYFKCFSKYNGNNFPLIELIPPKIDFQQKRKLKIAYKLLSIDLNQIVADEVWINIFDKKEGYIEKRHKIVHTGVIETVSSLKDLDRNYIKKATFDICQFVYELDKTIVSKYPRDKYPDLHPITINKF